MLSLLQTHYLHYKKICNKSFMDSVLVTYLKYGDWEISVIVDQSQGKDRREVGGPLQLGELMVYVRG